MRTARLLIAAVTFSAALFVPTSCRTTVPVNIAGLSAAEIFQRAQDASDGGDHHRAIAYYEGFLAQSGDDTQRGAWARYEIALQYHKLGDDDTALARIDELLALYPKDPSLPPGPQILAEKIKVAIEEKRSKKP